MEKNITFWSRKEELDAKYEDGTLTPEETKELLDLYVDGSKKSNDGWTERNDSQLLEEIGDDKRISAAENIKKAEALEEQFKLESINKEYRNGMWLNAIKNNESSETCNLILEWKNLTEQYINDGKIIESVRGIEFVDIWLRSVSKSVHDSVVKKAFEWSYELKNKDSTWNRQSCIQVSKDTLDAFMNDSNKSFEWTTELMSEENLNIILSWIGEKYQTNNKNEQVYILHMINPGILWDSRINETSWNWYVRNYICPGTYVSHYNVANGTSKSRVCSLSLVEKC